MVDWSLGGLWRLPPSHIWSRLLSCFCTIVDLSISSSATRYISITHYHPLTHAAPTAEPKIAIQLVAEFFISLRASQVWFCQFSVSHKCYLQPSVIVVIKVLAPGVLSILWMLRLKAHEIRSLIEVWYHTTSGWIEFWQSCLYKLHIISRWPLGHIL